MLNRARCLARGLGAARWPASCARTACDRRQSRSFRAGTDFHPAAGTDRIMKICFFGSSLVSSYWNGAATYYRGILKALAALGHEIVFFEPDAFERQSHRDISDPEWAKVVVYPATSEGWQRSLEKAIGSADLLVKASGVGVFDRGLECAMDETTRRWPRA